MYGVVLSTIDLTPHVIQVVLGGDGLADYEPVPFTDSYLKVFFPPADAPYEVPFDEAEVPADHAPAARRYTVRRWDADSRQLTLEFIVHEGDGADAGIAGPWARAARVGDRLQLKGPSGDYRPDPTADHHLLVGDECTMPAIAASLEAMPPHAVVTVIAVCDGPAEHVPLTSPATDLDIRWLHRRGVPEDADLLLDAVREMSWPTGRVQAFVHGEAGEVRTVRRHLLADRGVARADLSASGYWRRTLTDEGWRAIKPAWNAEMEEDVET